MHPTLVYLVTCSTAVFGPAPLQLCSLFVDNTRGSVGAVQITAQNFEAYRSKETALYW